MMVLPTDLEHVVTADEHAEILKKHDKVMICCGRMGPMCTPVYAAMLQLRKEYPEVKFMDMLFDSPEAYVIRDAPECAGFMGLPFTMYYKDGQLVKATSGIQTKEEVQSIIDKYLM